MPFTFYKSWRLGPLVVTLTPSGLGVSIGAAGLRVGRSASGRRTLRISRKGTRLDVPLGRRRAA